MPRLYISHTTQEDIIVRYSFNKSDLISLAKTAAIAAVSAILTVVATSAGNLDPVYGPIVATGAMFLLKALQKWVSPSPTPTPVVPGPAPVTPDGTDIHTLPDGPAVISMSKESK
jgi:hypothetical protein